MDKNSLSTNEPQKDTNRNRDVVGDVVSQLSKLTGAGRNVGNEIGAYVKKQPLAAVGIAVGSGFVLGSFFGSRLGRLALVATVGYVARDLIDEALGEGGVRKILVDEVSKLANGNRQSS